MDLSDRWPLTGCDSLRDDLLAAYADPSRGYHDTRHLLEVLTRLDELAAHDTPFDRLAVALAAWFHDGVYDGERDAEERSATWAEQSLASVVDPAVGPAVVVEVARLIRLTETHRPEEDDAEGCALSDADLAILAASDERYAEYVAAVRVEHSHLDEDVFRQGRAAVLRGLADKDRLFHTAYARAHWETSARANLERELGELEG